MTLKIKYGIMFLQGKKNKNFKKEVFIMTKKVTKREMFNAIKATLNGEETSFTPDEMTAAIDHEIELLDKKSNSKKPSKTEEANAVLREEIVKVLGNTDSPMTASDVLKGSEMFDGMSNQKISALLRQLVNDSKVVKATDKRKTMFSLA